MDGQNNVSSQPANNAPVYGQEQMLYDDAESVMANTEEITLNLPVPASYSYSQVRYSVVSQEVK